MMLLMRMKMNHNIPPICLPVQRTRERVMVSAVDSIDTAIKKDRKL
jgi:hypothetical protein